jgi:hypothetical protein
LDVDARYPFLSALAKSQGYSLNALGKGAQPSDQKYLRLTDCCSLVLTDSPRWAIDAYDFLATIDEWVKRFQGDTIACQNVWRKLLKGGPSTFLDTIIEIAWALRFMDQGAPVSLEVKFDPSNPHSKDADLVVELDGRKYWLDVISVGLNQPEAPSRSSVISSMWRPSREQIAASLAKRAERKYSEKFKDAVRAGSLAGNSVGVLLCVLKSQMAIIPQFYAALMNNIETPPPPGLFGDHNPGLEIVWVHTFGKRDNSELIGPSTLAKWMR